MSNSLNCKHCGKTLNIKQFGRHLWKIHAQKYEDYVGDNIKEFSHLNWKFCIDCDSIFKGTSTKCGKCYTNNHKIKKDQYIECKFCNKKIHSKVISIHLKSHHDVEFLSYVNDNLDYFEKMGWCKCYICGKITKKQGFKQESTCSYECLFKYRKTLTGEKSPRYGSTMSDITKEKISKSNKGKPGLIGDLNPSRRKEVAEKISTTRIERGVAKGENNPMFGKTHTPEAIRKIFSHRPMNKLEQKVADELNRNGIGYTFQFFINEGDVCKSYDFKLKERPIIIEVDGDFWHGNPNTTNHFHKVDEVKENDLLKEEMAKNRGYKIIRLWESDINEDISIVMNSLL